MSSHEFTKDAIAAIARLSTGNAEIDEILAGGFPANSINIVMGQPGTGKSIMVESLVFHNASADRPILYLTTMSEPQAKVIRYLQLFSFYDESKIGTSIIFDDLGPGLAEHGVGTLLSHLEEAIKKLSPKIIVIDSFKAIHDLDEPSANIRRLLYEMAGLLTAYNATAFLVGEYTEEHARQYPEFGIADGIIQVKRSELSTRDERFLRVLKLRGSQYIEGLHAFQITPDGLEVYPRLVSPTISPGYKQAQNRISTGVAGLDEALGGGLWQGSSTLLTGASGSGKTTIAMQFALAGAQKGEDVLYVHFQENPVQFATRFLDMDRAKSGNLPDRLHVLYKSPVELQIDSIIIEIFRRVRAQGIRRVVIDSIADLAMAASDPQRLHNFLYALTQHLAVAGVTCYLTFESEGELSDQEGRFSYMSDNVILLGMAAAKQINRTLTVTKARGTAHDLKVHELELTENGARVI
jgi:circadian clock protein KaiC